MKTSQYPVVSHLDSCWIITYFTEGFIGFSGIVMYWLPISATGWNLEISQHMHWKLLTKDSSSKWTISKDWVWTSKYQERDFELCEKGIDILGSARTIPSAFKLSWGTLKCLRLKSVFMCYWRDCTCKWGVINRPESRSILPHVCLLVAILWEASKKYASETSRGQVMKEYSKLQEQDDGFRPVKENNGSNFR